ncbi:MAG: hypothetical protein WC412_07035, partial [Candidatus Omnitrophota bacterium]
ESSSYVSTTIITSQEITNNQDTNKFQYSISNNQTEMLIFVWLGPSFKGVGRPIPSGIIVSCILVISP